MNTKHSEDQHSLWWIILIGVLGGLIYLLSPILTPFILAAVIAYICNPLVSWLLIKRISRTLGTVLVMLLSLGAFIALILVMVPLFEKEIMRLVERAPDYLEIVKELWIPSLKTTLGIDLQLDVAMLRQALVEHWKSAGGVAAKMLPSLTSGGMAVLDFLMNLLLTPVVLFYLLRDWNSLISQVNEWIPPAWRKQLYPLVYETDRVLAEFLRGQIAVIILMSGFYVTGLWMVGLEFAVPIGLLAGILVFVPYLGAIVGLALATFAAVMQFQEWSGVITVWLVFGIGQLLESLLITPWLVGERIGLHPVMVIFALLAFGQLFGFIGILLALPISAVLLVWLRHLHKQYLDTMQS
ncbi:AI-2E family transporter [Nitrosomonas sp. Is37]|uniref:AI-2E family transporter n=1 Tax=Nitrosomonas sp. Is37 TaxID=3080535 RepID=UPI00294B1CBD|nr:AI-2E family transporter [Nitrosomonas sp. Is37]MDV6343569.1 AI-2E family transporter [Nitrosomonas sp. Is37]